MADDSHWNEENKPIIEEFRANEGRIGGRFEGGTMLILHTTGARTGAARLNPLRYQPDGDRLVVFASRRGEPPNPDWYYNLLAHPRVTVEVGTDKYDVTSRVATGDERERLWSAIKRLRPGFADYEQKTDRRIPVVVLERPA